MSEGGGAPPRASGRGYDRDIAASSTPPPSAGRPRDPEIDAAVLQATRALLAEAGYARLGIEQVARQAGTTKAAVYRRWPSRQHLVLAALGEQVHTVRAPDTGCTLCDLDESLKVFVRAYRRMPPEVLGPLFADCAGHRELRELFMATLFEPPRQAVRETLERAHRRGDLRDDVDLRILLDLCASWVHYRALFGHAPTSDAEIERAVEALLQGVSVDYARLLEHSRAIEGGSAMHRLHADSGGAVAT